MQRNVNVIGATGLTQYAALNWHLRSEARERHIDGARIALQHNVGPGGRVVVTLCDTA